MATSHRISTTCPRGGRPLVEDSTRLHVRDLRGPFGWFGAHEIPAPNGTAIRMRLDIRKRYGWIHMEHWPAGGRWASSSYDLALFARDQPFGGLAWVFSCPLSSTRTPILYLPPGASCFGSRQAQGLAFASQRQRAPARAAARAQRIRADLGVDGVTRPKGQHAATYARRLALLAELDGAAESQQATSAT